MGIRLLLGRPVRQREIVLRARPTRTIAPPFAIKALCVGIILIVSVIGMSQLSAVAGSSMRGGELSLAMPQPAGTSPLFGILTGPTRADEPAHLDAPPTVITAVTHVRQQVEPAAKVVSAVLRPSRAVGVVAVKPAPPRAHVTSKHATKHVKATKTRTHTHTHKHPGPSDESRDA
jgi:hypothetical protein